MICVFDWEWIKNNKFNIVNLVGSICSTIGFAIVLINILAVGNTNLPPEINLWRYIFLLMSIVFIACSIVFTSLWISEDRNSGKGYVLSVTLKILFCIFLIGIGFDALISALYWKLMFRDIVTDLVRTFSFY